MDGRRRGAVTDRRTLLKLGVGLAALFSPGALLAQSKSDIDAIRQAVVAAQPASLAKLKAHLAKHGFGDIEVNVSGGYGPTQTPEDSALIRAEQAVLKRAGVEYTLTPRSAGSWPGIVFTGAPLRLPAGQFGLGTGGGAHAPDEFFVIESSNPKVAGLEGATMAFVDFLYQMAVAK